MESIAVLAAGTSRERRPLAMICWNLVGLTVVIAAVLFFPTLGLRPDITNTAKTIRFLVRFIVTTTLTASAFGLASALLQPGDSWRRCVAHLTAAPLLVLSAAIAALFVLPAEAWIAAAMGLGALGVFLLALQSGAPAKPALAGAATLLLACAIATAFYPAQCADHFPLFMAIWPIIAVAGPAGLGAVAAERFVRW